MSWYNNNNESSFQDSTQIQLGGSGTGGSTSTTIIQNGNDTSTGNTGYDTAVNDLISLRFDDPNFNVYITNKNTNGIIYFRTEDNENKVKIENGKLYLWYDYNPAISLTITSGWTHIADYIVGNRQATFNNSAGITALGVSVGAIELDIVNVIKPGILAAQLSITNHEGRIGYLEGRTSLAEVNDRYTSQNIQTTLRNSFQVLRASWSSQLMNKTSWEALKYILKNRYGVLVLVGLAATFGGYLSAGFAFAETIIDYFSEKDADEKISLLTNTLKTLENNPDNNTQDKLFKTGLTIVSSTNTGGLTDGVYNVETGNAELEITISSGIASITDVLKNGEGFAVNDTIQINKSDIGGTTGTLDIIVTMVYSYLEIVEIELNNQLQVKSLINNRNRRRQFIPDKNDFGNGLNVNETTTTEESGENLTQLDISLKLDTTHFEYDNSGNLQLKNYDNLIYTSPNGSVGINTTTPSVSYKLDVNGDINIASGSKYKINGNNLKYSDIEDTPTIIDYSQDITNLQQDINSLQQDVNNVEQKDVTTDQFLLDLENVLIPSGSSLQNNPNYTLDIGYKIAGIFTTNYADYFDVYVMPKFQPYKVIDDSSMLKSVLEPTQNFVSSTAEIVNREGVENRSSVLGNIEYSYTGTKTQSLSDKFSIKLVIDDFESNGTRKLFSYFGSTLEYRVIEETGTKQFIHTTPIKKDFINVVSNTNLNYILNNKFTNISYPNNEPPDFTEEIGFVLNESHYPNYYGYVMNLFNDNYAQWEIYRPEYFKEINFDIRHQSATTNQTKYEVFLTDVNDYTFSIGVIQRSMNPYETSNFAFYNNNFNNRIKRIRLNKIPVETWNPYTQQSILSANFIYDVYDTYTSYLTSTRNVNIGTMYDGEIFLTIDFNTRIVNIYRTSDPYLGQAFPIQSQIDTNLTGTYADYQFNNDLNLNIQFGDKIANNVKFNNAGFRINTEWSMTDILNIQKLLKYQRICNIRDAVIADDIYANNSLYLNNYKIEVSSTGQISSSRRRTDITDGLVQDEIDYIGINIFENTLTGTTPENLRTLLNVDEASWLVNPNDTTEIYYNTGNVGIGTDNPTQKLDVRTNQGWVKLNPFGHIIMNNDNSLNKWLVGNRDNGDFSIATSQDASGDLIFQTNDKLTILENGDVGIGKTAPVYKLDVFGDINFKGNLYNDGILFNPSYTLPTASSSTLGGIKVGNNLSIDANGVLSATDTDTIYTLPTASASTLGGVKVGNNLSIDANGILSATGGSSVFTLNGTNAYYNNGNVGIGTDNPLTNLNILGTDPSIRVVATNTDGNAGIQLLENYNDLKLGSEIVFDGVTNMLNINMYDTFFGTTTKTEAVAIKRTDGNVGIGLTPTNYKLDVNGDVNIASGSKYKINGNDLSYSDIANTPTPYTLPTASSSVLGGVKIDTHTLQITDSVLSVIGGGTTIQEPTIPVDENLTTAVVDTEYKYIIFKSSTTTQNYVYNITFNDILGTECDILVVGGGGGGGGDNGGGGGGGCVSYLQGALIPAGDYTISIGRGGIGTTTNGWNGYNSSFLDSNGKGIIAFGGGGGKEGNNGTAEAGGDGGSGGGAGAYQLTNPVGGSATLGTFDGTYSIQSINHYGNAGGSDDTGDFVAGGGGGANQVGSNGSALNSKGGDGIMINIIGEYYWGGGGGGAVYNINKGSYGGLGGGGAGGLFNSTGTSEAGTGGLTTGTNNNGGNHTGGGGGGGKYGGYVGGNGGTGIVIIKYKYVKDGYSTHLPVTLANTNYLTISGQEITGNTIPISSGGTGAITQEDARTNLGLSQVASTGSYNNLINKPFFNVNHFDVTTDIITGNNTIDIKIVPIANGGTGAITAEQARTNLGVDVAGTDNSTNVTLANTNYLTISGQEITGNTIPISSGGTGATTQADARTNLGLSAVASSGDYNDLINTPVSSQWTTTGNDIYYNNGNVGIGTNNPNYKLEVNGNIKYSGVCFNDYESITLNQAGWVKIGRYKNNTNCKFVVDIYGIGNHDILEIDVFHKYKNASGESIQIKSGLAFSSSSSVIKNIRITNYKSTDIYAERTIWVQYETSNTNNTTLRCYLILLHQNNQYNTIGGLTFQTTEPSGTLFQTNDNAITYINHNLNILEGNVGIGTTNPTQKLDINGGGINITNQGNDALLLKFNTERPWLFKQSGTGAYTDLVLKSNSNAKSFKINNDVDESYVRFYGSSTSGNVCYFNDRVRIGSMSSPSYTLDVAGNVRAYAFYQTSDKRLKNNIQNLNSVLDLINGVNVVSFNTENDDKTKYGFIAQELENIIPNIVNSPNDDDDYYCVDYVSMIPLLTKSTQELHKIIKEQENRINKLEEILARNGIV